MYQKQVADLISLLEKVQKHPQMYIGLLNYHSLLNYLNGIETGLSLFDLEMNSDVVSEIARERGWRIDTTLGAYPSMKEAGLLEAEIVDEVLTIHLEMWRRTYHSLPDAGA